MLYYRIVWLIKVHLDDFRHYKELIFIEGPICFLGTDAPDGLPSTEQMSGGFKVRHESVEIMRGTADHDSMNSVSQDSCISDCASGMKLSNKR